MILIVAEPPAIPVDSHQIHQIPGMAGEIPGNPEITGKQFPQTKPLTSEPPRLDFWYPESTTFVF